MKASIFLLFLLISHNSVCQQFKRLSVGAGGGYTSGSKFGTGILLYFEPSFRLSDAVSIGLKYETAAGWLSNDERYRLKSYTLNGEYYFSSKKFRPLAGLGIGLYHLGATYSCDCISPQPNNLFGFYPRAGFDYGHLALKLEYNFVAAKNLLDVTNEIASYSDKTQIGYLSARLGFIIGGGRKSSN